MDGGIFAMESVLVVGCGAMGQGIAQVLAQHDVTVYVLDQSPDIMANALRQVAGRLLRLAEKNKMSHADAKRFQATIHQADWHALPEVDLVIEAVIEDVGVKQAIFTTLDQHYGPNVVFASNTSSISITRLSAATARPDKVIGVHFFNPPPIMPLVEIIPGEMTSSHTIAAVEEFARAMGKEPIILAKDTPGFVVNRILVPMLAEAMQMVEENVAPISVIDQGIMLGLNHPMGPLALSDFIGLDVILNIMDVMFDEFKDPRYKAPHVLRRMVRAGNLGRKTKQGFYRY